MEYIKHIRVFPRMSVGQLVDQMRESGVLGAGKLGKATEIVADMFKNPDYTVFLAIAGPMVAGGLRKIISDLVEKEYVNVIVTSGANVVHDVTESLGYGHIKGSFLTDDVKLREKKIGRIGDVYIEQSAFEALEKKMYEIFEEIPEGKRDEISIYELLRELGKKLQDPESILAVAAKQKIPVFSPGLLDSMIGLHIWTFSQLKKLRINSVLDLHRFSEFIYSAKKIGTIILGGGVPKHYVLGASILREGVDAAVQITLDRPEGGSLSGAPLEEAISWRKAKVGGRYATVIGDATIIFPVMVAAALESIS